MCLLAICVPSLEKCLFRSSATFWLCCLLFRYWAVWSVCVFWRLTPCQSHHLQKCPPVVWAVFILLMVSFAMQKLFILIRSQFFIFAFIFISLKGGYKRILLQFPSKSALPVFSSKSICILSFTFKSLICFEFILLCGFSECLNFILLPVAVQFSGWNIFENGILKFLSIILLFISPF